MEVQETQSKLRSLGICASDSFPPKCIRKALDLTFMIYDMTHPGSMNCSGPCVINSRTRLSPVCPYFDCSSSRLWNPPQTCICRWIVFTKWVLSLGLFLVAKWCLDNIRIVWLWNREAPWHQCRRNPYQVLLRLGLQNLGPNRTRQRADKNVSQIFLQSKTGRLSKTQ